MVPETINGSCTAYIYTNRDDIDAGGRAIFYSDSANRPQNRRSQSESLIDLRVGGSRPAAGWRTGTLSVNSNITAGSYLWFGVTNEYFWYPRFDVGLTCYAEPWSNSITPNTYPQIYGTYNFKLSMYFTYTNATNYVRTLTQGITLTDKRAASWSFKRVLSQTVQTATATRENILKTIYQKIEELAFGLDARYYSVSFLRSLKESVKGFELFEYMRGFFRRIADTVESKSEVKSGRTFFTHITEKVQATANVFRGLVFFVRIYTQVFIRDYVLSRFLKAKSELVLKSGVCLEIVLENRL